MGVINFIQKTKTAALVKTSSKSRCHRTGIIILSLKKLRAQLDFIIRNIDTACLLVLSYVDFKHISPGGAVTHNLPSLAPPSEHVVVLGKHLWVMQRCL